MNARESFIARTNGIRNARLPGFDGAPLELVTRLIVKGLFGRGVLVTRASSIAFNMLMAPAPCNHLSLHPHPLHPHPQLSDRTDTVL
ncbi:MAG: hypothetical protein U5L72_07125 [Bacteroidales bacterium]|nr:hypothetical protein [Bacteroidales bacterium]